MGKLEMGKNLDVTPASQDVTVRALFMAVYIGFLARPDLGVGWCFLYLALDRHQPNEACQKNLTNV